MMAASAHVKAVELVCCIDEDVPQLVDGDANRFRQILSNLVSNAIAFTAEGEVVVSVSVAEQNHRRHVVQCDVKDTGCGIAPELQANLFEAFRQGDSSSTRKHGGLGIGLTIASELVGMMSGQLWFQKPL